jgi:hypothetical protein
MTANVRKLALDFSFPWLVPVQILIALTVDLGFLQRPDLGSAMTSGVMLALQGTATNSKVALWRTLPLTHGEVGRARWWQMIGLPGIAIIVLMGAALVLHALLIAGGSVRQPVRPGAAVILLCLLVQFFYPVFLTLFGLAVTFARITRSAIAYAALVGVWAPWLLLLANVTPGLSAGTRMLALGLVGTVAAAILYVTAPLWPQPVTQPMQLEFGGDGAGRSGRAKRAGQRGWAALCGMALLRPALMTGAILFIWTAMVLALKLDGSIVLQLRYFIPFIVILQITQFNAAVLRALRILPGSTVSLTAFLFLLPLTFVALLICCVSLILGPLLTGAAPRIDMVALSAALVSSALALPAALGMRQAAIGLVVMLPMALFPLIVLGWDLVPPPWHDGRLLGAITAAVGSAGFLWMHVQIGRGTRVYRLQPFVPASWRGDG